MDEENPCQGDLLHCCCQCDDILFYQLYWTQACPEGMGTNRTNRSHARCHPYPIPQPDHTTWPHHPGLHPLIFFQTVVWVLLRPTRTEQWKSCETGPTVFLPYPRRQKNLTICRCHYKGSTKSSQLFKDPECCSSQGLNLWPPTQLTGTLPTELTGGSLFFHLIRAIFVIFFSILKKGVH